MTEKVRQKQRKAGNDREMRTEPEIGRQKQRKAEKDRKRQIEAEKEKDRERQKKTEKGTYSIQRWRKAEKCRQRG